jgi:putative transposase
MRADATKVIKLKLEADDETFCSLDGQSKICNWLYNHLLEKANTFKQAFIDTSNPEIAKIIYTERGLRNLIPELKQQMPFLKSVHSSPLKNTALRLSQAIQTHQKSKKGKRKGDRMGWPKFRSWQSSWFSLLYDEPGKGFKIKENYLKLSLGGRISLSFILKEHHLLKGQTIRNLRIVKQNASYYAIFTVQIQLPKKQSVQRIIVLDPNHKNMAYGIDNRGQGIEIIAPNWLKIYDKRIDELKSKRDRCLKKSKKINIMDALGNLIKERYQPSRKWRDYQKALQKALHKRQEQTKTYVYTLAHYLCRHYDLIAIGDYTPKGEGINSKMRRAMNNRSLIGRFKNALKWVTEKSGKLFTEYEEKGTTRTCNKCHHVCNGGLLPSVRSWTCPSCNLDHIRDENAAINGMNKILRDLKEKSETMVSQVPSSGLFQAIERWAWCVVPSGVLTTVRGQNSK